MDFRSTNAAPQPAHQQVATPGGPAAARSSKQEGATTKLLRYGVVALLFGVTILVIALTLLTAFSGNNGKESQFVNNNDYQAVFLTNGQVYFGKVSEISSSYVRLHDIYYLTQNTTTNSSGTSTTNGNYTLVKLGCQQIHDPVDEMIIERSQVSFWENLNASGKVVSSIKQFQQQNPKGPDCTQVSNQTQASSNSTPQSSTTKP